MKKMLIIDGHSDFLEASLDKNIHIDNKDLMFNLKDAYNNRPYIQFSSIFIHTKYIQNKLYKVIDKLKVSVIFC